MNEKSNMNARIQELLEMLDSVDDLNREIIEKGSVKVEKKEREVKKEEKKVEIKRVMSPREMVEKLNETVIGQDEVKKSLAVAFFKYLTERLNEDKLKKDGKELTKSNIMLTGLSGNGKTYTVEQLCKILDMDYIVVNCASITSPGFKGGDIENELERLFDKCDGNLERIKKSVVILDEIDKLRANSEANGADVGGSGAIKNFLKILEGTEVEVEVKSGYFKSKAFFNTKDIMFIGCGTFMGGTDRDNIEDIVRKRIDKKGHKRAMGFFGENEYEEAVTHERNVIRRNITADDIIEYGFSPELLGRFSMVLNLEILTLEDYIKIAKLKKNGFDEYKTLFNLYEKKLTVSEDVYELLAENMMKTETGSRSLKTLVDKICTPLVYDMTENTRKKNYKITKEYVEEVLKINK